MSRRILIGVIAVVALSPLASCSGPQGAASAPKAGAAPATPSDGGAKREILYYRNAMGLPDTSPVPKKDAMGMDYVPVYAGEDTESGHVTVSADRLQKLGVRTQLAILRPLSRTLRLVGTVQINERLESTVNAKFEGWITTLLVNTTGERVSRGQPLLEVYSPDLVAAQQDYQVAVETLDGLKDGDPDARASAEKLVRSSLERLRNWDIADADLAALRSGDPPRRTLTLRSQRDGIVLEKMARVGMRFMPGEPLYQIADLSAVWLMASVFEQDISRVRIGQHAMATLAAFPGRTFTGTVRFISPVLQPDTRTAQVRIEFVNREGLLKPAMFANVEIATGDAAPRLTVPDSAVLDTGTRQLVIVDRGGGLFEPREVKVGLHGDGFTEVLAGLAEHESVVVDGNFLIDSESNLKSAIQGIAGNVHGGAPTGSTAEPPANHQHPSGER